MKIATKIAASAIAVSLALGVAVPASAAVWSNPGQLRSEIAQLDRQIDQAKARRIISKREAAQLETQVDRLQSTYRSFARGGFTRYEVASLNTRIDQIKRQLVVQSRDDNRRAYDNRYDQRDSRGYDSHRR